MKQLTLSDETKTHVQFGKFECFTTRQFLLSNNIISGPVEIKAPETCSEEVTAETDSENTLRGIDDLILHNSPRLQLDLMKIR